MGSVYAAERLATHQLYAIKFLREDHLDNESSRVRFNREIQALRSIRHPHVVGVFDAFAPPPGRPGRPWVVMELLEGEGLDRLLRRRRSLSPNLAVSIMLQVLDGLAAVHACGIVHRDLGPSNIFLVPQPHGKYLAKVLDFGLSRVPESDEEDRANITQKGTLMGKPAYVAPEMFLRQPPDARGDLYACGVMLFRMIAGRLPYRETHASALWAERYETREHPPEAPRLGKYVPGLPPPLEECVAKALRNDPDERYPSAEKMQADLLEIEQHVLPRLPEPAYPARPAPEVATGATTANGVPTPRTLPPRTAERWRLYAGGAAIAAAAAAAALAIALVRGGDEPRGTGVVVPPPAILAARNVEPAPEEDGREPDRDAGAADAAAPDIQALPDAAIGSPATAPAEAGPLAGPTVHFAFRDVPADATVTVDGIAVDPAIGIDLPQADRTVEVVVASGRPGLRPYRVVVPASRDQVIRPRFRRATTTPSRDAGSTVIHGQQGTTFVLDLGGNR